ncbi:MAG: protein kinase, partial [Deltaproteobacteria bacterium]|nr:protein kinase [Deltaproteobacteria bacterium]
KSENVLVTMKNGKPVVKIIDFGIAVSPAKYSGAFTGSIPYMAPEVVLGLQDQVDARADLFSGGVLMYYCVTWGATAFYRHAPRGDTQKIRKIIEKEKLPPPPSHAHNRNPDFPKFYDTIIMRLIAKMPKDRVYTNARSVFNALRTQLPDAFIDDSNGSSSARAAYLIPQGNRHVGREKEQEKLYGSLEKMVDSTSVRHLQPSVFAIAGEEGLGKSHLLEKLKQKAGERGADVFLDAISFPADAFCCDNWANRLTQHLAETSKPSVILIDNLHEFHQWIRLKPDSVELKRIKNIFERTVGLAFSRRQKPELFGDIPPLLIVFTFNPSSVSLDNLISTFSLPTHFLEKMCLKSFGLLEVDTYLKATLALKDKILPQKWVESLCRQTEGIPRELRERLQTLNNRGMLFDSDGSILIAGVDEESVSQSEEQKKPHPAPERAFSISFTNAMRMRNVF